MLNGQELIPKLFFCNLPFYNLLDYALQLFGLFQVLMTFLFWTAKKIKTTIIYHYDMIQKKISGQLTLSFSLELELFSIAYVFDARLNELFDLVGGWC